MIVLSEITGALDTVSDEQYSYYDRLEERVVSRFADVGSFDDAESVPEWQKQEAELNRLIQEDEEAARESDLPRERRFIPLPDRFEIDEWSMMERFAAGRDDESHSDELLRAIQGGGGVPILQGHHSPAGTGEGMVRLPGRMLPGDRSRLLPQPRHRVSGVMGHCTKGAGRYHTCTQRGPRAQRRC